MKREGNTKERILTEAMTLFSVYGYEAVSVRAIADAVGVGDHPALLVDITQQNVVGDDVLNEGALVVLLLIVGLCLAHGNRILGSAPRLYLRPGRCGCQSHHRGSHP